MSVCYSTATATKYTTITASIVSTSRSHIISTLPASATTLTSSICPSQSSGDTTGTRSCRTVTSVSSVDGGTTTVQVPIVVTVTTTSVSPLSTLYSTTCSSSTATTTSQTTVSTSAASSATSTTTSHSHHRSHTSTATTVIESSVATSAAASASSSSSDNTALIVGAAVGGGIGLIIVVLLGWLLCRRRHRHRREVDYFNGDKPFDGNAMVRPTPYPFRDHNTGTGSSSGGFPTAHSEREKGHSHWKPVPALSVNAHPVRESDVDPASSFAPQAQTSSATSPSLSVPTKRPTRSLGSIPTTSPSSTGVPVDVLPSTEERPHARTVVSEGTPSNPSRYHAAHPTPTPLPRGSGPSAGRPPPLSEKAQIHLHPDRGLTVVPHGAKAKAPRSGPPAARDAAWRGQGQGNVSELDDHRPEGQVRGGLRGGGKTGGSDPAPRLLEAGDGLAACGPGTERQAAATGMAREKRRRQEEHGGEEWEGEAPPAYCE